MESLINLIVTHLSRLQYCNSMLDIHNRIANILHVFSSIPCCHLANKTSFRWKISISICVSSTINSTKIAIIEFNQQTNTLQQNSIEILIYVQLIVVVSHLNQLQSRYFTSSNTNKIKNSNNLMNIMQIFTTIKVSSFISVLDR